VTDASALRWHPFAGGQPILQSIWFFEVVLQ